MNRDLDHTGELIDLGAATAETKGGFGPPIDDVQQLPAAGLSDD